MGGTSRGVVQHYPGGVTFIPTGYYSLNGTSATTIAYPSYSPITWSSAATVITYSDPPPVYTREYNRDFETRIRAQVGEPRLDTSVQRSKDLLLSCLTTEQRDSLEKLHKFRCVSDVGDVYEIETRRMHNVFLLNHEGKRVQEWCVTPQGNFPVYDVMLAQKLALETDSRALAERANITDLWTGRMVRQADIQYNPFRGPDYLLPTGG